MSITVYFEEKITIDQKRVSSRKTHRGDPKVSIDAALQPPEETRRAEGEPEAEGGNDGTKQD